MKIAVCDDEIKQLGHIAAMAEKWAKKYPGASVTKYSSAEELIFNYFPGKFDILLLDIQMSGESGISLAKKIRDCRDECSIIFITTLSDYVFEGYDVGAVSYLLKPVDTSKLFECMDKCACRTAKNKKLVLESWQQAFTFYESEIYYLEALSRKTVIHLKDGERELSLPFEQTLSALSGDFFRCHRSYCVNLSRIRSLKKYEAILDNAVSIPVSRRLFSDFNKVFIKYYR